MQDDPKDPVSKDDYLWDRSGDPDPETQRLENLLGRFRHDAPAPEFSAIVASCAHEHRKRALLTLWIPLAAAAAIILAIGAGLSLRKPKPSPILPPQSGWDVAWRSGAPQVGAGKIRKGAANGKLSVGQLLVTDAHSRASIQVSELGEIDIEPQSRVRLLETQNGRRHISLERGMIHATIWAPPGEFVVDTPSAVAVDLGCAYTLQTDESGSGILRTSVGWVGFQRNGHESFIPAGAACPTDGKAGPGTPYFEDASEPFRLALYRLDFDSLPPDLRAAALDVVIEESRKRDALSLWHLLSRVTDSERPRVYDRLAALVPPPSVVTRESALRLDPKSLDLWWNELDLGDIEVWRHWEHSWSQPGVAK
jgi:hypothetical protein